MSDPQPVDLIFDIGKTNKKWVLFDEDYEVVGQGSTTLNEVPDDDGYPGEDLSALRAWILKSLGTVLNDDRFEIKGINISGYGASIVNLDSHGQLAAPFYNYTKPLPEGFYDHFFERYGHREAFALAIASPLSGMLNSGLQLFYLQQYKPKLAARVKHSLHFPQYLSYLITGKMVSDYTSLGCHTGLWDFGQMKYHRWVEQSGIVQQLPPIVRTDQRYHSIVEGRRIEVGVGVHDSSAALLPYLRMSDEPFVLLSTGTWSVSLNPFNDEPITSLELKNGCLCYMNQHGKSVKASRVFLGKAIENQVAKIAEYFHKDPELFKTLKFDPTLNTNSSRQLVFHYDHLDTELFGYENGGNKDLSEFDSFESAYQLLMDELTNIQITSLKSCLGQSAVKRIYIDGGFSSNNHFTQMLANKLEKFEVLSSSLAAGPSLGAALLLNDDITGSREVPVEVIKHEAVSH